MNFDDPRSALFFEYLRIYKALKVFNPNIKFLLENVKMSKQCLDVISEALGVQPVLIDSSLVSAQNRKRYYWTNIGTITPPEDKGIMLSSILESKGSIAAIRGRYLEGSSGKTAQFLEFRHDNKSNTLTTVAKDNVVVQAPLAIPVKVTDYTQEYVDRQKAHCLVASGHKGSDLATYFGKARRQMVFSSEAAHKHLKEQFDKHEANGVRYSVADNPKDRALWRDLTPIECERLQTLPDNYTAGVSKTQRLKMLGNGWTVDVITCILKGLLK